MRTDRFALRLLAVAAALAFLAGCPGTLSDKERFLVDAGDQDTGDADANNGPCGDVVARIFVPSCGGTGCHSAMAPQQGLDLVSPGVASRVVGVIAKGCPVAIADPANPTGSLIYQKLSPSPPCGSPMPLARPPLSDADATCVFNWIVAQGAPGGGSGGASGGAGGGAGSPGGAAAP
ncbi:MAG: hypothetical protein ABI488_08890 [Polyangiaceae bacterium]